MDIDIHPHELAEIVTGLLVNPDMLVPMDLSTHQAFIQAIGEVVTQSIGGTVKRIEENGTRLTIGASPSEVWFLYWHAGDCAEYRSDIRSRLQSLLSNRGLNEGGPQKFVFAMHDTECESDIFTAEMLINQLIQLKISNNLHQLVKNVTIEIRSGQPEICFKEET